MNKNSNRQDVDALDEYEFQHGVRGKYAGRYMERTNLVVLDPDVAEAFPTADEVNRALRGLLATR